MCKLCCVVSVVDAGPTSKNTAAVGGGYCEGVFSKYNHFRNLAFVSRTLSNPKLKSMIDVTSVECYVNCFWNQCYSKMSTFFMTVKQLSSLDQPQLGAQVNKKLKAHVLSAFHSVSFLNKGMSCYVLMFNLSRLLSSHHSRHIYESLYNYRKAFGRWQSADDNTTAATTRPSLKQANEVFTNKRTETYQRLLSASTVHLSRPDFMTCRRLT